MPSWDFRCETCGEVYQVTGQKMKQAAEDGTLVCVTPCYGRLKRVWQAVPAIFRGGGWGGS